jgi:hypothetical protein
LWGMGVTSFIKLTSSPAACSDLIAASLPEPGPLTYTSTVFNPCSMAFFAASSATMLAAYGVDFLEPLNPICPELAQEIAFPCKSVRVTIVLLKVDLICAWPFSMFLRYLFLTLVVFCCFLAAT